MKLKTLQLKFGDFNSINEEGMKNLCEGYENLNLIENLKFHLSKTNDIN